MLKIKHHPKQSDQIEIDPLGGILAPGGADRIRAELDRTRLQRFIGRVADWWNSADEPSIKTFDTELITDPGEVSNPTPAQLEDMEFVRQSVELGPQWDREIEMRQGPRL